MTNFKTVMTAVQKQEIFKTWVNDHSDVLYNYAMHHGFDEHGAKDFVQDTFLSAWRSMDGYQGTASVRTWLFVILKNKIKDHFRKACNKVNIESLQAEHNDQSYFDEYDHWRNGVYPKDWNVDLSNTAERKDFLSIFKGCCGKLKQIQSAVFVMKYIDGLDSDQICKDTGLSSSNYWVILHRAKVQLRACLEKNWMAK